MRLFDMHCHLGFADNARELAAALAERGGGALSATVEPAEYVRMREALAGESAVRVGLGLHPWWLDEGRCGEEDAARCVELACEARFIAEVGLDFGKRREASRDIQLDAFRRVCAVAGTAGGKVLSLHAVGAAAEALDVLEETDCLAPGGKGSCACILHWYSGPSDQLQRAVRLGCFFSINPRMLQTRRGREYARILPRSACCSKPICRRLLAARSIRMSFSARCLTRSKPSRRCAERRSATASPLRARACSAGDGASFSFAGNSSLMRSSRRKRDGDGPSVTFG